MNSNTEYYIEIVVFIHEDLIAIINNPDQENEIPENIKKTLNRSSISNITVPASDNKRWVIGRFWIDAMRPVTTGYNGDFEAFQADRNNNILRYLETTFTEEWHWFRPLSAWRWTTGLPLGCEYANAEGDVITDDPARSPWFPWDDAQAHQYWPDLIVEPAVYDEGADGEDRTLITPAITEDVLHDGRPELWHAGQCSDSRDVAPFCRRVRQVTTHEPLDAVLFGVSPWAPEQSQSSIRHQESEDDFIKRVCRRVRQELPHEPQSKSSVKHQELEMEHAYIKKGDDFIKQVRQIIKHRDKTKPLHINVMPGIYLFDRTLFIRNQKNIIFDGLTTLEFLEESGMAFDEKCLDPTTQVGQAVLKSDFQSSPQYFIDNPHLFKLTLCQNITISGFGVDISGKNDFQPFQAPDNKNTFINIQDILFL